MPTSYLLIGGYAAAQAAFVIREREPNAQITLLCAEEHPPYERPPLSKSALVDPDFAPESTFTNPRAAYDERGIVLKLGTRAEKIDRKAQMVRLANGNSLSYDKLLLAPGAAAKKPEIPGEDLPNVFFIRTLDDALKLRAALESATRVAVIGGSYLGLEVASDCLKRGLEVSVCDPNPGPWSKFASEPLQKFVREEFERHGVHLMFDEEVTAINGETHAVSVQTSQGPVECDLVVAATGATLNTELAADAGLEIDKKHGIVVDETLRTADENIWVAGDCACFPDRVTGKTWNVEHYKNALQQGRTAGANMTGANEPFDFVPYFFSDVLGLDLFMVLRGDPAVGKSAAIIGDMSAGECVELYASEVGIVKMAVGLSRDKGKAEALGETLGKLVRDQPGVSELSEADFDGFFAVQGL